MAYADARMKTLLLTLLNLAVVAARLCGELSAQTFCRAVPKDILRGRARLGALTTEMPSAMVRIG